MLTQQFKVVSDVGANLKLATKNANAQISVGSLSVPKEVVTEKNKLRKGVLFDVKYDCTKLKAEEKWWEDVSFTVTNAADAKQKIELRYKVLCEPENLYGLDLSMFVLFAIATIIVFIAFYTPDLSINDEMSNEERESQVIKTRQAVFFAICASFFLLGLYILL